MNQNSKTIAQIAGAMLMAHDYTCREVLDKTKVELARRGMFGQTGEEHQDAVALCAIVPERIVPRDADWNYTVLRNRAIEVLIWSCDYDNGRDVYGTDARLLAYTFALAAERHMR